MLVILMTLLTICYCLLPRLMLKQNPLSSSSPSDGGGGGNGADVHSPGSGVVQTVSIINLLLTYIL
jgi:hypothetical protein